MVDIQGFWGIIDEARDKGSGWENMAEPLIDILAEHETADIMTWRQIFCEYHRLACKNKLWAAAYVTSGGCSDDSFADFRGWLIAQGKDVYLKMLADPNALEEMGGGDFFEEILYVANDAYIKKLDEEDADICIDAGETPLPAALLAEIASEIKYDSDMDIDWSDESLRELLPALCEAFRPQTQNT